MKYTSGNYNNLPCQKVMKRITWFTLAIFLLACMSGCRKNTKADLRPDLNVANDQVLANRPFVYAFRMLLKAVDDSVLKTAHHSVIDSASVSLDSLGRKFTFVYHDNLCADSALRSGSFIVNLDSGFYSAGTTIRFTFMAYAEDDHLVTCNDSIKSLGMVNGQFRYDYFISNTLISKDSIHNIKFDAAYQVSVNPGVMWQGHLQKVVTFDGTSQGISSGGYAFTSLITKSITIGETCPWVTDGIISFSIPGVDITTGNIEYMGKTVCNDKFKYDFEGNLYYLRMKNKFLLH